MRDLNARLDQSVIDNLRRDLPLFDLPVIELRTGATENIYLQQYLHFYQLPLPSANLTVCAGHLEVGDNQIATLAWQPAKAVGTVIVVHGYMDHIGLFNHLIQHLLERQLNVVCFDLPGHGLSTGRPGYILDYGEYVGVLELVINISREMFSAPLHAVGQSMGGAVLLKHLIRHKKDYPFASLNLFAPLLFPRGWNINRWLHLLSKPFTDTSKRVYRDSSWDKDFLTFVRDCDPLQASRLPLAWVGALKKWIKEFRKSEGSNLKINLIQGDADKTLDWETNLVKFKEKFPALKVHIIKSGNHHLVNEIKSLREEIFAALEL
ncbi:alpha/beta hydrolase [Porticoccaceae bacterium]|nr:alpha/beta hydrolase [Porticoccaceae bacterium]MDB4077143.1 alpha/beta hydrolase [Porticoccaceae bacterium]MDB4308951.1 alpha/beta hydrolase [Porticoccaceae bacterium]MDB9953308.1 alpha/beta hydrolase [Porticoccaceae bacterium]MDB9999602.1 alpha/beta hydrolase [Porticoccaceae bacterium]